MTRIILLGYMGAGKTTLGRALAKAHNIPFYDLDWYIESRMRKTIPQIFAEQGEEGFRRMEYNMLHEVAEFDQVILSCGGGTPCYFDNITYMNQQGETIYLKASPDVLYAHLQMGKKERPLLKQREPAAVLATIQAHLQEREPFYRQAKHTLSVNLLDNFEKINASVAQLSALLNLQSSPIDRQNK